MARGTTTLAELQDRLGQEVGASGWITLDQARIDTFAAVTEDDQFIHTDPDRAVQTVFGGTIAHGFLTLSMLSRMSYDALPPIEGVAISMNYGFDSLRFLAPVRAGQRVRGRFTLNEIRPRGAGRSILRFGLEVEIEGATSPALVADWLTLVDFNA